MDNCASSVGEIEIFSKCRIELLEYIGKDPTYCGHRVIGFKGHCVARQVIPQLQQDQRDHPAYASLDNSCGVKGDTWLRNSLIPFERP